ncbi:MAG: trypsin-like peptidase domain-containing protein, partial [Victivallales bacterium]|nr:trypsin-like peptidase domain-containing protein [Victivallales bacterium]
FTNDWEVILSPDTHQVAMREKKEKSASVYTYSPEGYLVRFRYVDRDKKLLAASNIKRDEKNRRKEYTQMDNKKKPLYTYWFKWKDGGIIDRERQRYRQEKGERLHVYDYLKTDDHGNWTQRLMVRYDIGGEKKEKVYERLVLRTIEYFGDEAETSDTASTLASEITSSNEVSTATAAVESDSNIDNPGNEAETSGPVGSTAKLGRSQSELKVEFDYTFDNISGKLVIISCKGEAGKSAGSGFVAKMNGRTYLFTNQHVIMGADTISMKTADGETLAPRRIELSKTRDIARILIADRDGFEISEKFAMGIPLGVFGNSEGAGVATELFGEVTGLGVDLVEVNAEFVSGNSGSPVLDANQKVIGIASFVQVSWLPDDEEKEDKKTENEDENEDAEPESKTRRFCYRLTDLEWQPVKWKEYNNKYGKLYHSTQTTSANVFDILSIWSDSPLNKIPVTDDMASDLTKWIKRHNDIIGRYERRQYTKSSFLNAYSESLETLSKTCNDRSRRIRMFSSQRDLTEFLRDEFKRSASSLEYAGYRIKY